MNTSAVMRLYALPVVRPSLPARSLRKPLAAAPRWACIRRFNSARGQWQSGMAASRVIGGWRGPFNGSVVTTGESRLLHRRSMCSVATGPDSADSVPGKEQTGSANEGSAAVKNDDGAEKAGELEVQLRDAEQKAEELHERLLRTLADAENARHRHEKEVAQIRTFGISRFAAAMLEVADTLGLALKSVERDGGSEEGQSTEATLEALATLKEGLRMTDSKLHKSLESFGVTMHDPTGETFDPTKHEALFEVDDPSKPKGTIVQVVQCGYTLHDRVIRAAKVGCSRG
eukprot:GHVU01017104.1.p1 GENE.GHVU01017104.1~~GHVU01017104.1.p1  ORF type:complete len:287 (+),score=54.90 GHVU01017104.1:371-1231(+)